MTKVQEITKLETKAKNIQKFIANWKQEIIKYESTLLTLTKEINQLKSNTKKIWK
jgi:hypothetical protein